MPSRKASLRLLSRAAAHLPLGTRIHLIGRYLSCPFGRLLAAIPPGAAVLDVGAGHGALARLAVEAGARLVVAVEPDLRKLGSALRHPAISWVGGYDRCIAARFDAVVLCDVLYRVPSGERDALLGRLLERVEPGGLLLIKETDPDHRLKSLWNVAQETIAVRVLRLTLGSSLTFENRQQIGDRVERAGFTGFEATEIGAGYPHPHILYTARRPA